MSRRRARPAAPLNGSPIPADEELRVQAFGDGARLQARKGGDDKFNLTRKKVFIETLRRTGNVTRSAKTAGISPATAYRHRARYVQFDLAWLDALAHALDVLETTMIERALRFNASLSEGGLDEDEKALPIEPFSNGDAMRLIKLHRDTIAQRRAEILARAHRRPEATEKRVLEKLNAIYERIRAREQALRDRST